MISVKNTKELEDRYDLSRLPKDEKIRVLGGLSGKSKYKTSRYEDRTTYRVEQLISIIGEMKKIERGIHANWDDLTKAYYVYKKLIKKISFNSNKNEYDNQQSSNLSGLVTGSSICAGYSMIFKEMMDRQNIPCDYIRGILGTTEKHAWNVISVSGKNYGIDLTLDIDDEGRSNKVFYFGNNTFFSGSHKPDSDERKYKLDVLPDSKINELEESINRSEEIVKIAILSTYDVLKSKDRGAEYARKNVEMALVKYINVGQANYFTLRFNVQELIKELKPSNVKDIVEASYKGSSKDSIEDKVHYFVSELIPDKNKEREKKQKKEDFER